MWRAEKIVFDISRYRASFDPDTVTAADKCVICQDHIKKGIEMEDGTRVPAEVVKGTCGHFYHLECIKEYETRKRKEMSDAGEKGVLRCPACTMPLGRSFAREKKIVLIGEDPTTTPATGDEELYEKARNKATMYMKWVRENVRDQDVSRERMKAPLLLLQATADKNPSLVRELMGELVQDSAPIEQEQQQQQAQPEQDAQIPSDPDDEEQQQEQLQAPAQQEQPQQEEDGEDVVIDGEYVEEYQRSVTGSPTSDDDSDDEDDDVEDEQDEVEETESGSPLQTGEYSKDDAPSSLPPQSATGMPGTSSDAGSSSQSTGNVGGTMGASTETAPAPLTLRFKKTASGWVVPSAQKSTKRDVASKAAVIKRTKKDTGSSMRVVSNSDEALAVAQEMGLSLVRSSRSQSGFEGVRMKTRGKYSAYVSLGANGDYKLGTYDSPEQAALQIAYVRASQKKVKNLDAFPVILTSDRTREINAPPRAAGNTSNVMDDDDSQQPPPPPSWPPEAEGRDDSSGPGPSSKALGKRRVQDGAETRQQPRHADASTSMSQPPPPSNASSNTPFSLTDDVLWDDITEEDLEKFMATLPEECTDDPISTQANPPMTAEMARQTALNEGLELHRNSNKTGFSNVYESGKGYAAVMHRGSGSNRRRIRIDGCFNTAEEAALAVARYQRKNWIEAAEARAEATAGASASTSGPPPPQGESSLDSERPKQDPMVLSDSDDDIPAGASASTSGHPLTSDQQNPIVLSDSDDDISVGASASTSGPPPQGESSLDSERPQDMPDRYVVSGSDDTTVRVWSYNTGAKVHVLTGHKGSVYSVAVTPDGKHVVSGSADKTVRVWSLASGSQVRELHGKFHVFSVAVTPDGAHVVSGSADWTVRIWQLADGAPRRRLTGHTNIVRSVAVTPDGAHVVSGSWDNTVRVWSFATGAEVRVLRGHGAPVMSVAVTPDGVHVVSGSSDKTVRVWLFNTGQLMHTLGGHTANVTSVAVTPNSMYVVSGLSDDKVRVWPLKPSVRRTDLPAPALIELDGHKGGTISVATLTNEKDGTSKKQVVSGGDDNMVCVWAFGTGSKMRELRGHTGCVRSVAVTSIIEEPNTAQMPERVGTAADAPSSNLGKRGPTEDPQTAAQRPRTAPSSVQPSASAHSPAFNVRAKLSIPRGASQGDTITFSTQAGNFSLKIPPGRFPGETMHTTIPVYPQFVVGSLTANDELRVSNVTLIPASQRTARARISIPAGASSGDRITFSTQAGNFSFNIPPGRLPGETLHPTIPVDPQFANEELRVSNVQVSRWHTNAEKQTK